MYIYNNVCKIYMAYTWYIYIYINDSVHELSCTVDFPTAAWETPLVAPNGALPSPLDSFSKYFKYLQMVNRCKSLPRKLPPMSWPKSPPVLDTTSSAWPEASQTTGVHVATVPRCFDVGPEAHAFPMATWFIFYKRSLHPSLSNFTPMISSVSVEAQKRKPQHDIHIYHPYAQSLFDTPWCPKKMVFLAHKW